MARRSLLFAVLLMLPRGAPAQEITKRIGLLAIRVDTAAAYPGGLLLVRLNALLGSTTAVLNGIRVPFYQAPRGPYALVPIPVLAPSGNMTLGIELVARRGRERIPVDVPIAPRAYPPLNGVIPEAKRPLLEEPGSVRESRQLLELLRSQSPVAQWKGPFLPPVAMPPSPSFGGRETLVGATRLDSRMDSIFGEYHRGLDYDVPEGTVVQAPAAGTVLLAGPLILTGETLVIDHGQGIVSAFFHLGRIDVHEGERIESGSPVGLSGATGVARGPHVHWGLYLHGVAVDPTLLERPLG